MDPAPTGNTEMDPANPEMDPANPEMDPAPKGNTEMDPARTGNTGTDSAADNSNRAKTDRSYRHRSVEHYEKEDDETDCSVRQCKPAVQRRCANMAVFTGVYSMSALLTSTLISYLPSQVTTLERHFGFNSSQTGLIMAANDVGFLVVVLFISYMASQVHIPRALGFLSLLFGVSGILCALPFFLFGAPRFHGDDSAGNVTIVTSNSLFRKVTGQICDGVRNALVDCDAKESSKAFNATEMSHVTSSARASAGVAFGIIIIGMMIQGVAKAPRSAFVTTYVDDNVQKTKTGFYLGVVATIGFIGHAAAYALGGIFSTIYVTLEDTNLHPRHPNWIGAWWLGYVTFGLAACVFALPLFCFPRRIRTAAREPVNNRKYRTSTSRRFRKTVISFMKGWLLSIFRLCTNPVYTLSMLSSCALSFSVAGTISFMPKYIENQFSLPAWKANISMAGASVSICLGTFLGGYFSRRFKMGGLASLKVACFVQGVSVFASGLGLGFKCEQSQIYNSPGPLAVSTEVMSGCYDDCACDDDDFFPICDGDGRTFFSPCHAGCTANVGNDYLNCTCAPGQVAMAGMCEFGCSMFAPFVASMFVSAVFETFTVIPKTIIYIRSVAEHDRPLSVGISSFMTSIAGWMLGPIVFGNLIDGFCIQWESSEDSCTGRGACRLYDNDIFRWKLIGYQTLCRLLGLVLIASALVIAIVTKKFDTADVDTKGIENFEMAENRQSRLRENTWP